VPARIVQTSVGGMIANRKSRVLGLRARYASKSRDVTVNNMFGISFAVKGLRFSSGGKRYSINGDRLEIHVSISELIFKQIFDFSIMLRPISVARPDIVARCKFSSAILTSAACRGTAGSKELRRHAHSAQLVS
jgi:hypothetical protein